MKYILFDLDGTLTESGEGIMNSAEYAFRAMGREVPDRSELRTFVGPPLSESFPRYGFTKEETVEAIRQFRVYFKDRGWKENKPYEGIVPLCAKLAHNGYYLIVATSKIENMAQQIIDYFGMGDSFFDVVGSIDGERSTKAEVIAYTLKKHGISPEDAVMVGDRCFDVEGAAACGIATVGVTYGYGTRAELEEAGAVCVVGSVEELGDYFGTVPK